MVDGGQYQTWVPMKLSFDDMEKILARQRTDAGMDAAIDKQFDELDRRIKELRAEQREAAKNAGQRADSLGLPPPEDPGKGQSVGMAKAAD